jgi:hypothetical protein
LSINDGAELALPFQGGAPGGPDVTVVVISQGIEADVAEALAGTG